MFFWLLVVFVVGSAIGSFLNVVADRTVRGEGIGGRSYCDHCRATLSTIDLVPIVSFITLGAKCRFCKKPLSWQYPIVEMLTAVLFVVAFWNLVSTGNLGFITFFYYLFLISTVAVVAVVDFKYYLIPTTFVYFASLIALFYNYFSLPSSQFVENIIVAFVLSLFFLFLVLITRGKGMGQGDIVLAFLMGIVLGMQGTFVAVFLAFLTGAAVSVALIILRKKKFGQVIPFAPFLVMGFIVSLFWSSQLIDWYFLLIL